MKSGLILEGGAMRGLFTAGATDIFLEHNITFDGAIGVSAGAAFGCNFKSKQTGRVIRYNEKFCRDKRYCSLRSLITTGDLYGADFCYRLIPEELDRFDGESFCKNPMEFYVVCTDVESGEAVYQKIGCGEENYFDWIRASASMPLASRVVEIDGRKLLDGGVSDSVPLTYFETLGYDRNVVILTQPKGYRKEKNKMMPLIKMSLSKYPKLISAMEKRHEMYNKTMDEIDKKEAEGKILVLRPDEKLRVGHVSHDPQKLRAAYNIGRTVCTARLLEIKAFLEQ